MIKSFLLLGQSNMAGRGHLHEVKAICNERILMLRNGRWQMMSEPINYDRPVAGVGPAASFADAWCHAYPDDQIGLIPCAEGGSEIDEWAVGETLYRHAVNEAKFAMETSQLAGILWHQGESDSHSGKHETYYDKLRGIMDALRQELGAPNLPILIGGLGDYLGKSGFGASCTEHAQINCELKRFAFEHDHCYFVDTAGLTPNSDGIHIDAFSQRKFGLRYFEAFYSRQHVLAPLSNEEELIALHKRREHTKAENMYLAMMQLAQGELSYSEFEARLAQIQEIERNGS